MTNSTMMAAMGVLALTAVISLPAPTRAALLPGQPTLCLVNSAIGDNMLVSDYARSGTCFLGLDEMYRGTLRSEARDLIASVTHWALGFNVDMRFLGRIGETLGITARDKGTVEVRAENSDTQVSTPTRRSFFMKASRKQIFVGFGMEW